MEGVSAMSYMDALISVAQQRQGVVLQKLMEVQANTIQVQAKPLKAISTSTNLVDVYA